jgi:cobalt/nickel transport system permease protein
VPPESSLVHRAPAGLKLGLTLAMAITVVALPRRLGPVHAGLAAALVGAALASRLSPLLLLRRLLVVELLSVGAALLSLLQPDGLRVFLSLLARSTLCLAATVLLASTTSFAAILAVLRRCRLPGLLLTTLALLHRYLFVLAEEAARISRARRARSFARGRRRAWGDAAAVAAGLFVRSSERAARVHDAMVARGWK